MRRNQHSIATNFGSSPTTPATPSFIRRRCCASRFWMWRTSLTHRVSTPRLRDSGLCHSQGGLLAKAGGRRHRRSGANAISYKPSTKSTSRPERRELLRRGRIHQASTKCAPRLLHRHAAPRQLSHRISGHRAPGAISDSPAASRPDRAEPARNAGDFQENARNPGSGETDRRNFRRDRRSAAAFRSARVDWQAYSAIIY